MDLFNATLDSIPNRNKGEAHARFSAFQTRNSPGRSAVDFLEYCQFNADSLPLAETLRTQAIGEQGLT